MISDPGSEFSCCYNWHMIDTHTHLNLKRLYKRLPDIVNDAQEAGVTQMIVPGIDVQSSRRACQLSREYKAVSAAVGIHPHDVPESFTGAMNELEQLLSEYSEIVAIGEIGLDYYSHTEDPVTDEQREAQKKLFQAQVKLALKHKKVIIIHNRDATYDMMPVLDALWQKELENRIVFHCCEPREDLLDFAIKHKIFIGVDGDVTYDSGKAEFIKKVPGDLLVLETDAPFLLPEPLKSEKKYPNVPANLQVTAQYVANLRDVTVKELEMQTNANASKLFNLS